MTTPSAGGRGDHDDLLLDVLLEEALGGQQPPDLSERIAQALATRTTSRPLVVSGGAPQSGTLQSGTQQGGTQQGGTQQGGTQQGGTLQSGTQQSGAQQSGTLQAACMRGLHRHWLSLAATVMVLAAGYWTIRSVGPGKSGRPQTAGQPQTEWVADASADTIPDRTAPTDGSSGAATSSLSQNRQAGGTPAPQGGFGIGSSSAQEPDEESSPAPTPDTRAKPDTRPDTRLVEYGASDSRTEPRLPDARPPETGLTGPRSDQDGLPKDGIRQDSAVADVAAQVILSAVTDRAVVATIDGAIRERWREAGVRPSPVATDAEWCRRVFLDVIGRIPTIEELESFLVDHRHAGLDRRAGRTRLVDRLLNDDEYAEAYARHWTTIWTNLLIGRSGGMAPGSPVNREGLQQYLRRSFLKNKPYDQLALELISAQGSNTPGEDDYNGAVNFVLDNLQENAATATAKTAQIFLGLQIQCTQCHNHPFNEWKQNRFWELNAFFRQTKAVLAPLSPKNGAVRPARLVDEDFAGEGALSNPAASDPAASDPAASDPAEAEIYYEQRNGEMRVAYPVFVDGIPIDPNGLVRVVHRRDELSRLVVRSDYLGQALVNRLWGHFFGYGFTKPIDDLGTHNPPSHPELLEKLGREFAVQGHDLKRLIRWVILSEAYSLSSKFGPKLGNQADDPTLGVSPLFSHFYLRQMTAEQLYDSLLVATEAHRGQGNGSQGNGSQSNRVHDNYEQQQRTKDAWARQFTIVFGTDDNGETTTFDGTITQALMMMNGELTRRATSVEAGGFLSKVAERAARVAGRAAPINHLYLAALGRKPSRAESQLANGLLTTRDGNAVTVLEDVWWALLNSNEFILNH